MQLENHVGFPGMFTVKEADQEKLRNSFKSSSSTIPAPLTPLFDPMDDSPVVYESSLGWMEP